MTTVHPSIRPFLMVGTYLFLTKYGYLAGGIVQEKDAQISVQYGPDQYIKLTHTDRIKPHRLNQALTIDLSGNPSGYVQPKLVKGDLKFSEHPGSGLFGLFGLSGISKDKVEYQSKLPLTLHDKDHQYLLVQANASIQTLLKNYLRGESFDSDQLNQLTRMINAILYIDDYPSIPSNVIQLALMHFLSDLTQLSENTWIDAPLNYILRVHSIDSICYQDNALALIPSYQLASIR